MLHHVRCGLLPLLCLVVLAIQLPGPVSAEDAVDREIDAIRSEIETNGYQWTPRRTWVMELPREERAALLGLKVPPEVQRRLDAGYEPPMPIPIARDLPTSYDWRDYDGVTAVKNQASCGSCWDFAGVGALECALKIHEGTEYDLSEQQILSCRTPYYGCGGGWPVWVWSYVRDYGAVLESCMPYQADDTVPCADASCTKVATARRWLDIPNSIDAIKTAVLIGPLSTTFTVYSDFYSYGGGCYEHSGNDPTNHAVVIVGWDDNACSGEGAWLCKNSWSEVWGEGGFFWIKYGTCNIGSSTQLVYYYDGTHIVYDGDVIDDTSGDGDGFADPKENIDLTVTLRNDVVAPDRTGVQASLSTSSSYVTLTQSTSSFGDIDAGDSAGGVPAFGFTVDEFAPTGQWVEFVLSITADGAYANSDTFDLLLGPCPILLVDDDAGTTTDTYFKSALDNNGYIYDVWEEDVDGPVVSASQLAPYTVVIWNNGWSGMLEPANQTVISSFLDSGGKLMISGEDIGWSCDAYGYTSFYNTYLHADYINDDSGYRWLVGVPGDPIGDGLGFTLNGDDSAMNQFYPSEIEPRTGATGILEYTTGMEGALRYDTGHREVYLAFGFEGVTGSATRDTIMRRCLEWLSMGSWPDTEPPTVALVDPNGGTVTWDAAYEITWTGSDNVDVTGIDIYRSWDSGATFPDTLAVGEANDGSFVWAVPESASTTSRIRVVARDAAGLASYDDSDSDFSTGPGTYVPEDPSESRFGLSQNVPNPFNPVTRIAYSIREPSRVVLAIYDGSGRLVRTLVDRELLPNDYVAVWDGRTEGGEAAASGIYFYQLTSDGKELDRKMILLR